MTHSRATPTLYEHVIGITESYLGPASERFIARQVEHHLHKHPSKLKKKDLEKLIEWARLAMSLLIDDNHVIEAYVKDLRQLG